MAISENVRNYIPSQNSFNDFLFSETQASNSNSHIFKSKIQAQHTPKLMLFRYMLRKKNIRRLFFVLFLKGIKHYAPV